MKASWYELITLFLRFRDNSGLAWQSGDSQFNYHALYNRACDIAHLVKTQQQECQSEFTPVIIYGHKAFDFVAAWWACLLCGSPVIPVEADNTPARLSRIAQTTGAGLLINTQPATLPLDQVPVLSTASLAMDSHQDNPDSLIQCTLHAQTRPDWHGLAYIMFSSGTTGEPKGIKITLDNLADFVRWIRTDFPIDGPITGNVRYCFDVSLFELWGAWSGLQPVSVLDHAELINTRKLIAQHAAIGLSFWVSTPSIIRLYLLDKTFNHQTLPHLKRFLFCGETLTKDIVSLLWARFPGADIINTYGPTECTVAVTSVHITSEMMSAGAPLPIGEARAGTTLHLEMNDAACDSGVLLIRGASVGAGYLNAPADREASFTNLAEGRCYNTGDTGTFDGRFFYFLGRRDREVKIQGYRIDLHTIEHYLLSCRGISGVIVEPFFRKGRAEALQIFIVTASDTNFALLAQEMLEYFPAWSVPRYWYRIADIQLNHNGKLDQQTVKQTALMDGCHYVFISGQFPF